MREWLIEHGSSAAIGFSGAGILLGLFIVIVWAIGWRRDAKLKELQDGRPRCKHGRDKFRGPKCEQCYKEAEEFFAKGESQPQSVPISATCCQCIVCLDPCHCAWSGKPHPCECQHAKKEAEARARAFPPLRLDVGTIRYERTGTQLPEDIAIEYRKFHDSEPPPVAPSFRVNQWVRHKRGALGRVVNADDPNYPRVEWLINGNAEVMPTAKVNLFTAVPNRGEVWQWIHVSCSRCEHSSFRRYSPGFFKVVNSWEGETLKFSNCVEPLNFGRGNV